MRPVFAPRSTRALTPTLALTLRLFSNTDRVESPFRRIAASPIMAAVLWLSRPGMRRGVLSYETYCRAARAGFVGFRFVINWPHSFVRPANTIHIISVNTVNAVWLWTIIRTPQLVADRSQAMLRGRPVQQCSPVCRETRCQDRSATRFLLEAIRSRCRINGNKPISTRVVRRFARFHALGWRTLNNPRQEGSTLLPAIVCGAVGRLSGAPLCRRLVSFPYTPFSLLHSFGCGQITSGR